MTWATVLQEVRQMRFEELYEPATADTHEGGGCGHLRDHRTNVSPLEWALAGITEMAVANRYLMERFLPLYNERIW